MSGGGASTQPAMEDTDDPEPERLPVSVCMCVYEKLKIDNCLSFSFSFHNLRDLEATFTHLFSVSSRTHSSVLCIKCIYHSLPV